MQPVFGLLADRRSLAWMMPVGIFLAALFVGLAAIAPSYELTFAAVVASGLGVAAFHPEGSRYANYLSGTRRATGMSLFSLGGNAGFALGPALVTPAVALLDLRGALVITVPAAAVAFWVWLELPRLSGFRPARPLASAPAQAASEDDWGASGRLGVVIGSLTLASPLVLLFLAAPAPLATPLLFVSGAAVISSFAVTVVMGQEYLPGRIGVAFGITLGLAIGLGGIGAPLLGLLADAQGLEAALIVAGLLPLIGVAATLTLPGDGVRATARAAARLTG